MLLDMLVLLDSILQMQLFQINQSEDSSETSLPYFGVKLRQGSTRDGSQGKRPQSLAKSFH